MKRVRCTCSPSVAGCYHTTSHMGPMADGMAAVVSEVVLMAEARAEEAMKETAMGQEVANEVVVVLGMATEEGMAGAAAVMVAMVALVEVFGVVQETEVAMEVAVVMEVGQSTQGSPRTGRSHCT